MYTMMQYIDEVKLRLNRLGVMQTLHDSEILTYINEARRAVQKITLPLFPERYGKVAVFPLVRITDTASSIAAPVTYSRSTVTVLSIPMPRDMIDAHVAILTWQNTASHPVNPSVMYRREARRVDKRELFSVTMHSWNVPTCFSPIYSLEIVQNVNTYMLRLAGIETTAGLDLLSDTNIASPAIEVWYTAAIDALEDYPLTSPAVPDTDILPPDTEELVVLYAMLYCLQNVRNMQQMTSVESDIEIVKSMIVSNYETEYVRETALLPSKQGDVK